MKKIINCIPTIFIYKRLLLMVVAYLGFSIQFAQAQDTTDTAQTIVEVMPDYPGGHKALMKFLSDNINYPKEDYTAKIEGTVYISFIVARDGKIVETQVVKGVSKLCDAEAKRVVAMMPVWKPGMKDGRNVAVRYTMPIRFKL